MKSCPPTACAGAPTCTNLIPQSGGLGCHTCYALFCSRECLARHAAEIIAANYPTTTTPEAKP
jgi:hypothetical protein